jgi:hypothetical protein
MSLSWMPLPFPSCPYCDQSWETSCHRDCYTNGEIVVEPYLREAKCAGCGQQWTIMQTTFCCSCGHIFSAADVEDALSTMTLISKRLVQQIKQMEQSENKIYQSYRQSFNEWLYDLSFELGKLVGKAAAAIIKWLRNI